MSNVIGTCSKCGGAVVMPSHMVNPVACCQSCGARAKNAHGPIIPMHGGSHQQGDDDPYDLSKGKKGFLAIKASGVR